MNRRIDYLKIVVLSVCCFVCSESFSQNQGRSKIDSLLTLLKTAKEDTSRVNILVNLGNRLKYNYPDSSFNFYNEALRLSIQLNWVIGEGRSDFLIGGYYNMVGDNEKSLEYSFKALTIWEKMENALVKEGDHTADADKRYILSLKARSFGNIGIAYDDQGDYPKALQYYFKSLDIAEHLPDKSLMANQFGNVGIVYKRQGNYPKALEYAFKALKIGEEQGDKDRIAHQLSSLGNIYLEFQQVNGIGGPRSDNDTVNLNKALDCYFKAYHLAEELDSKEGKAINLGNIGLAYSIQGNYSKSLEYYFKALQIAQELGSKQAIALHLGNIANTYFLMGDTAKSLESSFKSLKIAEEIFDKRTVVQTANSIGIIYLNEKKFDEAEKYFNKSLRVSLETGDKNSIKQNYFNLATLDSSRGNYKSAFENYRLFVFYRDSIFSNEKTEEITRQKLNYDFEKKEAITKAEQDKKEALAKAEYDKQIAISEADKLRGIAEADKKRALAELNKSLELNEADRKFTESEADKKIAIAEADKKRLLAVAESKNIKIESDKKIADTNAEKEKQKLFRNSIAAGAAILILSSLVIFFFYKRKRDAVQKQKETALSLQISETEIKALRSQMNPHFIFNALQSIQNFLMNHQIDDANKYLLKFARLMRMVLENSRYNEVSLKEEMQALSLYMELESIRLRYPFTYQFDIDPSLDEEETGIPPLILQPFVENAIWHGLQHKSGQGHISISIKKNQNQLFAVIEDNGIGRNASKINSQKVILKKESLGMKLTEDRINILNQTKNANAGFTITDLYTKDNQATGTRVELSLPLVQ